MTQLIDKVVQLTEDQARNLARVSTESGKPEHDLITHALKLQFAKNDCDDRRAWSLLSVSSLNKVWDNDADSAYDDWRSLYGYTRSTRN